MRAEAAPAVAVSEVKLVTLGVADLDRSRRFYEAAFGYVERGHGELSGPDIEQAWRMPGGLGAAFVVVGPPGSATGLLRLVRFDRPGVSIWAEPARIQDLGHYAVNVRVREMGAGWQRLLRAGATPKSEPHYWVVNPEIAAWDSQCFDPDGVLLDVFEVQGTVTRTLGEMEGEASELQTIAIHVSDAERSSAFYQSLGFGLLYDRLIERMEGFFGMPPGTRMRNLNLMRGPRAPNGRIELAEYIDGGGLPLTERARPPNLGILSASFLAADLEASSRLLAKLGATPVGEAGPLLMPPFGRIRLRTFHGLDGELLELFSDAA